MLKNSKAVKVQNIRKTDMITNWISVRLEDVNRIFDEYIADGYELYDVVANAGFGDVGSGNKKYLCVWVDGEPTGTSGSPYTISPAAFSAATDVVITGIKLDSNYKIVKHSMTIYVSGAGDYNNKINAFACDLRTGSALTEFGEIRYSTYTGAGTTVLQQSGRVIEYSILKGVNHSFVTVGINYVSNSIVGFIDVSSVTGHTLSLTNVIFGYYESTAGLALNYESNVELINCYAYNCTLSLDNIITTVSKNTIYYDPTNVTISITGPTFSNYREVNFVVRSFYNWTNQAQILTTSYLTSTTAYQYLNARIAHQRTSIRGFLGTVKRNFYNIAFDPYFEVNDSLKYNDDTDIMLVWREDLETEFTANLIAKIKNFTLYKSDGTTAITTYRNNESFLIYATRDGQSDYAVFAWHKGEIKPTIYSEVWPDNLYTVVRIFQIWEHPEEVTMLNMYNVDDSPIEATYLMQDTTSKVFRI